ncbi:putative DNA helicase [Euzebya pacifica]|uniref:Putative DNA helicase n=1 Tax=Euzebya pacifica TaxID=1608957 RepID=A0A346XRZ7_9ACTN|nr:UvrD-helicase domain-containing protein [Euzebya pacifica]AXV04994.1 putative DNA helicase [Euzebya pacifica]
MKDDRIVELRGALAQAIVRGCRELFGGRRWSRFDLARSLEELWLLSRGEDCCYDRPSIGLNYALWYQGRRVQDVLRTVGPSWGDRPVDTIVDLGAGTGATAWALAVAMTGGLSVGHPRVVLVDGSPPMLQAAEALWESLQRDTTFGPAARRIEITFECTTWTRPPFSAPGAECIASYLFDHSSRARLGEVASAFDRATSTLGVRRVHLLSANGKRPVLDAVVTRLGGHGWVPRPASQHPPWWTGAVEGLGDAREAVLAGVPTDLPWRNKAPSFDGDSVVATRLDREELAVAPDHPVAPFQPDPAQERACIPDGRLTLVVGAAGSGKSRVLVERLHRTLETSRDAAEVLVTTFNIDLLHQLGRWFAETIDPTEWERRKACDGDFTFSARHDLLSRHRVRFLNWDKVPTRLFGQKGNVNMDSELPLERRVQQLAAQNGWSLDEPGNRTALQPQFLLAELHRVIWGLDARTLDDYLRVNRVGRLLPLHGFLRRRVWDVVMGPGHPETFSHRRIAISPLAQPKDVFDHVFIDECQDFTPADFTLAARMVADTRNLVAVGDSAQSMHLGPAYRRPGQMPGANGQRRLWSRHELDATYRLPLRLCEAIIPVARKLGLARGQTLADEVDLLDTVDLRAVSSALLGMRPVVLAGTDDEIVSQLAEVLAEYEPLFHQRDGAGIITFADGRPVPERRMVEQAIPSSCTAEFRSMRAIKGLERPAVVWTTGLELPTHESAEQWIYTILTRPTALLVVVLSDFMDQVATDVIASLDPRRLIPWTPDAEAALRTIRDTTTTQPVPTAG